MERWGEGEWGGVGGGGDRMQLQCHLDIPVITYVTVATCQFSSVKLVSNSNSIQKTLLSVAIVTIKRIFFFSHPSSATLNNAVKLNTLKPEGGMTHKEQLS